MRLLNDATSPFGRKVLVAAIERSIPLKEEFVDLATSEALHAANPLRQIPVVVLDNGLALYDSMTIMNYLDEVHDGPRLFPSEDRWSVMSRVSLCDGMMEATLLRIMELRRPANEQSSGFVSKLESRIGHVLEELETILTAKSPGDSVLYADDIAAICALGYLDLRYTTDWRNNHPGAAAWFESYADRRSVEGTMPTRTAPYSG